MSPLLGCTSLLPSSPGIALCPRSQGAGSASAPDPGLLKQALDVIFVISDSGKGNILQEVLTVTSCRGCPCPELGGTGSGWQGTGGQAGPRAAPSPHPRPSLGPLPPSHAPSCPSAPSTQHPAPFSRGATGLCAPAEPCEPWGRARGARRWPPPARSCCEGEGGGGLPAPYVLLKTPPRQLPSRRQNCCEKKTQVICESELCVWQRRSSSVGPRKAMQRPKLKKTLQ